MGKATIVDPDTGRPIYIGDGLVPQVERFASKYAYAKLTVEIFHTVLRCLIEKAERPTGNKFAFICNEKAWTDVQKLLIGYLAQYHTDASYMWSRKANSYVKVGATFDTYEFGGNQLSFTVDRTFSREYGMEKGYCLCLDLTADAASGHAPIEMFTLKGGQFITNKYLGVNITCAA